MQMIFAFFALKIPALFRGNKDGIQARISHFEEVQRQINLFDQKRTRPKSGLPVSKSPAARGLKIPVPIHESPARDG